MPTCKDRRPRLETPPSLPQREERLTVTYLNGSFYPKGCHKVGTDALVCPLEYARSATNFPALCGQTRASVPTLWYLLLFSLAVPVNEAMPCYMPTNPPFLMQTILFTPLSIRREDGVRLFQLASVRHSSPWGRMGGVSRWGRLPLLGGVGGVRTLPRYTPISPYIIRKSTLILMSSKLRYH